MAAFAKSWAGMRFSDQAERSVRGSCNTKAPMTPATSAAQNGWMNAFAL
jgi:hypothetical protein